MSKALKSPRAIPVLHDLRKEFEHWRFLDSWSGFLPWKDEKHFQLNAFSDVSGSGWGGVLRLPGQPQQEFHGHRDLTEIDLPIVVKEALALLFVLQRVARLISNARVDCFVDSAPLVACWKKDGSRNSRINNVLNEVFHLTLSANLHVILHFVPSQENPADSPSRIPSEIGNACSAQHLGNLFSEHLVRTPSTLWLLPIMSRKTFLVGRFPSLHRHPRRRRLG